MSPDKVTRPLGPRRAIANAIKKLREDRGKLLADISRDVSLSTSKLSRLENAQGKPNPSDISHLIRYYRIEGTPLAARLDRRTAVARLYALPFLPVLLQTLDYAREGLEPLRLVAVTHESCPRQMRQQAGRTGRAFGLPEHYPARAPVHGEAGVQHDVHVYFFRIQRRRRAQHRPFRDPRRVFSVEDEDHDTLMRASLTKGESRNLIRSIRDAPRI